MILIIFEQGHPFVERYNDIEWISNNKYGFRFIFCTERAFKLQPYLAASCILKTRLGRK